VIGLVVPLCAFVLGYTTCRNVWLQRTKRFWMQLHGVTSERPLEVDDWFTAWDDHMDSLV
jgi:hypothetical protein